MHIAGHLAYIFLAYSLHIPYIFLPDSFQMVASWKIPARFGANLREPIFKKGRPAETSRKVLRA